jgi:DNA (cytosine-5)-methyltransferase 1
MCPDKPAAAVTTASARMSSDNTIHPSENRVLSAYECQHLQTIPDDFLWGEDRDDFSPAKVREMIGEAVPPQFTERHGRVLASLLDGRSPKSGISKSDKRVVAAMTSLGIPY